MQLVKSEKITAWVQWATVGSVNTSAKRPYKIHTLLWYNDEHYVIIFFHHKLQNSLFYKKQ